MSFELAQPWALALLALPVLAAVWMAWRGSSLRPVLRFPSLAGLGAAPRGWRVRLRPLLSVLKVLALVLVVLAVARPRLGQRLSSRGERLSGIERLLQLGSA